MSAFTVNIKANTVQVISIWYFLFKCIPLYVELQVFRRERKNLELSFIALLKCSSVTNVVFKYF